MLTISKLILAILVFSIPMSSYGKFSEWKDCAEVSASLSESERVAFYERLKAALLSKDVSALSKMAKYPMNLFSGSKKQVVTDEKAFQLAAGSVFTPDFVTKLLSDESGSDVCNYQGLGIGNGGIWVRAATFGKKPEVLKIVTINK